VIIFYISF